MGTPNLALGSGNWSSVSWSLAHKPTVGEDADCNGFTVEINEDVTCDSLINTTAGSGSFTCNNSAGVVRTINAAVLATVRSLLFVTGATPPYGSLTINGNVKGGTNTSVVGVTKQNASTLIINGDLETRASSNSMALSLENYGGVVTINGNLTSLSSYCVNANCTGTVNVTGNLYSTSSTTYRQARAHTLTIVGNLYPTGGVAFSSAGGATSTIVGTVYGTGTAAGYYGVDASVGTVTVERAVGGNYGLGAATANVPAVIAINTATLVRVKKATAGPYGAWPLRGGVTLLPDAANTVVMKPGVIATTTLDYPFASQPGLLTNLLSWYRFNETSGTRVDSHGGRDMTPSSSGVSYAAGVVGNAVRFRGDCTLDRSTQPGFSNSSYLTIAGWVRRRSSGYAFCSWLTGGTGGVYVYAYEGVIRLYINGGGTINNYGGFYLPGDWCHFAFVFDGTQATNETRLIGYANSAPATMSYNLTIPAAMPDYGANGYYKFAGFSGSCWIGDLDQWGWWDRLLTPAEIALLATAQPDITLSVGGGGGPRLGGVG